MMVLLRNLLFFGLVAGALQAEDTSFTSYHFMGAGNCVRCHNGMTDGEGNDMSIETAWSSTMMANASKDPMWQAKVRTEINRNPHLEGVINDKCTKCHAPMANVEAHTLGDDVSVFDGGFLDTQNAHHDEAMGSVSCTLCHQIEDNGELGTLAGMSGSYEIGDSRTVYGPYSDVATGPMVNNVDYTILYSDHIKASKLCASCHNLKTPYVDENGNVLSTTEESEFPEQMPYSEWEHSDYASGQSCQDCHMKRADGVRIAVRPPWATTLRDGFAQHIFVGGNRLLLDILNNNKTALEVTADNFETTIAKAGEMLQSAASIAVVQSSLNEGTLEMTLKVTSTTGHKLPTGFPSRRAFLHVKVTDAAGNTVFESGRVNADGSIEGADADSDAGAYEPHYDLITSADQVQIYESIMENNLGEVTYTLLRALGYKKDNRILPAGFDKTTAASDIAVHGAAADDADFVGGSDSITYRVGGLAGGSYSVEAELLYQPVSYAFAQDMFGDTSSEAAAFKTMFDASSMKTSQIAATAFAVEGSGGTTAAACADGIDNDGDGLTDLADPGCGDSADDNETDPAAAEPETAVLLNDGFEQGMDAWTVSGDGRTWYASTEDVYAGSYSAYARRTGVGTPTYMEASFDASGHTTVTFAYSRRLKGLDSADDFGAAYYDGSWHDVERLGSGSEDGSYVSKSFTIPATATAVRFMCETGARSERCFVDNVSVTAE